MTESECISYKKSGYFTKLIIDYLEEKPELKQLYNRFPTVENFKKQIEEKKDNFPLENRAILVDELLKQYQKCTVSEITLNNIKHLNDTNTYTITTGHQLNLFTGPLYFLYKIISVINLCKQLKTSYPDHNFVPIYWMATEDHDFEEINHFQLHEKKIRWNKESFGPVGRLSTTGLEEVFDVFEKELGVGKNADFLKQLFQKGYLEHTNLADATRYIANELFKNEGLVILDGDATTLKKLFIPYVKKELLEETSFTKVNETAAILNDYNIQVNPREINLFYIEETLRERIVNDKGIYKVLNTTIAFSKEELLTELDNHPEKFSPNVILRPLYQEVILPNLCYIGGGGEIAYWLELKSNFKAFDITFPILLIRNSVVIVTEKQLTKTKKLNLTWTDLFSKQLDLINSKTKELSAVTIDFSAQKEFLKKQFEALYKIAEATDASFIGAVKAQEIKQTKGLDNLEKRLLKAEKRIHHDQLERIKLLQNELFPNQSLQERKLNFSEFYLEAGDRLIQSLLKNLKPLETNFTIITL
ncbi:MAG TPA: bacillithiol biosynthesis cysteine-adding enzyme BshC [Flavobacterium sp.]|jgi:bacillithiol biosynthesis cysteine-adding enzyme BshC|uniref:bacillithiol biosynthesis cysteine-adding enzyme BshC n=1 Tax=Flavobacterium sp. TaxID=239 RepID=UPI002CFE2D88|nr:bacillithiol biosynthesis cysteine-adding enzyme BshC [Flavobacterium sp.]MCA0347700.1 bacillithiol biosynthesis cysteine-adding enzyme BshC [Bacteroidota bacterium]HPW97833.1 bacillithiol biosynthesis cysteine-adding enzyme BshC [Flavobacterium sp.]HQA73602.1 bacillithiol biosynthesis cysteine-adding enzyme BshC [Flavobacterium sp.]